MAARGNVEEIRSHIPAIKRRLLLDEVHPDGPAIIKLISGVENFFLTNNKTAENLFLTLLPPTYNWSNGDYEGLTHIYCGANYRGLGESERALTHSLLAKEMIDPFGHFATYYTMSLYILGELYLENGNLDSAERYFLMGAEQSVGNPNSTPRFRILNGLSNVYLKNFNFSKCKELLNKAISLADTDTQKSRALHDLARFHFMQEDYDSALQHCSAGLALRTASNMRGPAISSQLLIGEILLKQKMTNRAKGIVKSALQTATSMQIPVKSQAAFLLLSKIYEAEGDWQQSLRYFKLHSELSKSISNTEKNKIFTQKTAIESFHNELKQSISYAQRIQQAILPSVNQIDPLFSESFILYKPKAIVSGDFYWWETIGDLFMFAVADCTGHGVPGAMVSVVCNNALNRAVREFELTSPNQILDKVRQLIIETFSGNENEVNDGMDISLCVVNKSTYVANFSGAYSSLYLFKKNLKTPTIEDLLECKGDKMPVGKSASKAKFTTSTIRLNPGDTIILSTDGYPDQFGGKEGKKLKSKPFKRLLAENVSLPLTKLRDDLETHFNAWKGQNEQVDDVCILGLRL